MLSALPRTFVTIVEIGSITGAADELGLAKSAVSQNLKRLEQQLGVKLAVRTTRHLSLTPAGKRYYEKCKTLIALAKLAKTEMETFGATPSGPITITAPHALIAPVIAPAMAKVTARFPDLAPRVIADDKRLDLIAEGIDVSITVGKLPDSSLRSRRVGSLRDILCVAPALMADAPASDDPAFEDWVQSVPYVAHVREPASVEHHIPRLDGRKPARLRFQPGFRSNTIEAIAAFAREGLGVALLPDIAVLQDLKAGHLMHLCGSLKPETTSVHALHAYDTLPPKSVHETIDAIQAVFASCAP